MPNVVDVLRAEHRNMSRVLDVLERQVLLFENGSEPDYELMGQIIDYFRRFPDLYHHPKEELILRLLRKRAPDKAKRFGNLEDEHEHCSEKLQTLTRLVVSILLGMEVPREEFTRTARDFIHNERRHMKGEEESFLPVALEKLTDEDWHEIDQRTHRLKDPLSEPETPYRFDLLHEILH